MKEKYTYRVYCTNCGADYTQSEEFGQQRPMRPTCQRCGCMAYSAPKEKEDITL